MFRIESHLLEIPLRQLRPTQMTVGFKEVDKKRKSWRKLGAKARQKAMDEELFPVVKGPGKIFYILDHHHHTAVALKALVANPKDAQKTAMRLARSMDASHLPGWCRPG